MHSHPGGDNRNSSVATALDTCTPVAGNINFQYMIVNAFFLGMCVKIQYRIEWETLFYTLHFIPHATSCP